MHPAQRMISTVCRAVAVWILSCACASPLASADDLMTIAVTKRGAVKSSISLSGLAARGGVPLQVKQCLENDLVRSGWFTIAQPGAAAFEISGSCDASGEDLRVKCLVKDQSTDKLRLNESFRGSAGNSRRLAHEVADRIVAAVKGRRGIAGTRIVMVGTSTGSKELYICDADGRHLTQVTNDRSISVAPDWSPDAGMIVYTSFRTAFPYIYSIDLKARPQRRERLTQYPGLNMGAAISPNGKEVALSLSKDGNPDLYVMTLQDRRLTRVTRTRNAGEASPAWSPDGRQMAFVSDSSGRPNIYIVARGGGRSRRVTFDGSENVSPDWGPGGVITFSSRRGGRYQVCLMDPASREERQLTHDSADHEDPSWAPDGRHIVYARTRDYHSNIYILDTMGDGELRLTSGKGDWYSPAWSPK